MEELTSSFKINFSISQIAVCIFIVMGLITMLWMTRIEAVNHKTTVNKNIIEKLDKEKVGWIVYDNDKIQIKKDIDRIAEYK